MFILMGRVGLDEFSHRRAKCVNAFLFLVLLVRNFKRVHLCLFSDISEKCLVLHAADAGYRIETMKYQTFEGFREVGGVRV